MAGIIFFGTPDYVTPVLDALKRAGHDITAVVTQPPKPVGRRQELTPSPVAQWAEKHSVPVITDLTTLLHKQSLSSISSVVNAGVGVLEAYGRIIPREILHLFPHGIVNVHPSLLPRWRGASPIEATIVAGDAPTGVTIMRLDEELDHGPILAQFKEVVRKKDTKETLRKRLFDKAAQVIVEILPDYLAGKIEPREQEHSKATYTTLIKKDHGFLPPEYLAAALKGDTLRNTKWEISFIEDYSLTPTPSTLERFVRALYPWPGAWTKVKLGNRQKAIGNRKLKILKAHLEPLVPSAQCLVPDLVQLEGKKPVSWKQFLEGHPEVKFSP